MPMAWELKENKKVLVAILHTDLVSMAWALGLRNLVIPGEVIPLAGMPYDHARNEACRACLEHGFDYLFFLDSDVVPPRDCIPRLISHRKPLVSGLYFRRSPPHGVPVMMKPVGQWIVNYPQNVLLEVDCVGTGCMLIHRTLLEKLPAQRPEAGKHWFDWRVDCRAVLPHGECLSEDFTFCVAAKKVLNIPTLVDTGVVCKHIGLAQAGYGTFTPCETAVHT